MGRLLHQLFPTEKRRKKEKGKRKNISNEFNVYLTNGENKTFPLRTL